MASWTASFNSSYQLELVVTQESQNVANNTSSVKGVLRMKKLAGSGNWANDKKSTWNMSLNGSGTSGTFSFDFRNYTTLQLTSRTITVTHNSDGAKSINVSASSWADLVTPATATIGTKSFGLTTIPRASTASLGGATTTGSSISVTISRKSSSFTHNVQYRVGSGSWINVATAAATSASFTVPHTAIAANGSATVTVQVQTKSGSTNIGGVITLTRTVYGPKTNSIATFNNFTIGNTIPFTITRPNSSFTSTARIYVGGTLVETLTGLGTSGTFSANTATYLGKLPSNGKSTTVTIQLDTMSGSTKIGSTVSKTATATGTDAQLQPSVPSITATETGSGLGVYTQSKSKINVKTSASTPYNSSITEYRVTVLGSNYYGSNITTNTVNSKGSVTISVRVVNSRGISRTNSTSVSFFEYSPPKITTFTGARTGSGENNLTLSYNFSIAPVNNKNSKQYRIRYRKTGGTWTTFFDNTDSYGKSETQAINGVLGLDDTYEAEFYIADRYTSATHVVNIPTSFALINFNASGKGIAFGGVSTKNSMEVFMPVEFKSTIQDGDGHNLTVVNATHGNNADLNTITKSGMHRINGTPKNAPAGGDWGQLLVVHGPSDTISQVMFPFNQDHFYFRSGNPTQVGGSGAWRSWSKISSSWGDITGKPSTFPPSGHTHNELNGGSWNYSRTDSGYIQFGPANPGYAHIYTDRPQFYFNKEMQINGNQVMHRGNTSDFVVEQGSNYTKWNSGKLDMWGSVNVTPNTSFNIFGATRYYGRQTFSYPVKLIDTVGISMQATPRTTVPWHTPAGIASNGVSGGQVSLSRHTQELTGVDWRVIGRWK